MKHLRLAPLFLSIFLGCTATADQEPPAKDAGTFLVTGGTVVTMDAAGTVIDDGTVAVRDGRIAAVGPRSELEARFPGAEILDAGGGIVLPGLVNTHTHVPMTLFRGMADDLELMEWLEKRIFPAEAANVDEDFVRWGTRLACLEMIRGGTTTFVDMYYYEDAIAEEASRCGLRAVLGQTLIDFPAPDNKTWEKGIAATERFLERWKDHPLITPAVAPHAAYTVSGEHLRETHRLAAEHGAPYVIHLAEQAQEIEQVREQTGQHPIAYLDGLGVLDERVIAAHVVLPDEAGIATLARRGVGVAHNPQSNMKIAVGVAPVVEMLAAGVHVGLGTDGAASNNDLDMWEEIDTAAKLHKVIHRDPTVLDARTVLAMATIGGARAIHLDAEIGSLEPGKRADLVVVGLDGPHQRPLYDVYSHLVYTSKAADVAAVMVEGRVLYRDGRHTTLDPGPIYKKAVEYRDQIRASLP